MTLEDNFESILDRLNATRDELSSLEQAIEWRNAVGRDTGTNDFFYKGQKNGKPIKFSAELTN